MELAELGCHGGRQWVSWRPGAVQMHLLGVHWRVLHVHDLVACDDASRLLLSQ